MLLAVSLDPDTDVSLWGKKEMKAQASKRADVKLDGVNGWHWIGKVPLSLAIANWKWRQENLGKTFGDSIWVVTEVWIFPEEFSINEDFDLP